MQHRAAEPRHILVATRRVEGFCPANNYTESCETTAFAGWTPGSGEILHQQSPGAMYTHHANAVRQFKDRGYVPQATRLVIDREEFIRTATVIYAHRCYGVARLRDLTDYQRWVVSSFIDELRGGSPFEVSYAITHS